MASRSENTPLIVIVGQTASGKSALAMHLARRFGGEIVAADSRTVYRGMDIGTAKPTPQDRAMVPHHLIDVVNPDEPFNVADFQRLANAAIDDIVSRGKLPILVGGTGLYVDAVIYNFGLRKPANPALRRELESLSVEELQARLIDQGLPLPRNERNPRHLIRAIEAGGETAVRAPLRPNTLVIGLQVDPEVLRDKIARRVDAMVKAGLVEEVRRLSEQYGWDVPALQAPAYKAFRPYIEGRISLEEAKQQFARYDWQYARRQKTWFRRNKDIVWIDRAEEIEDLITSFLSK
ncbi:tRNA (adenosine(37)-N6)-dimethylallyltransferase MiaA [Candidatus Saccharibacteria bacterium]|nr:tRNA (adenosine(37)-N6)-dimethylallyltransferase MiaA [Candidatus Saccharibacteria bacterium]